MTEKGNRLIKKLEKIRAIVIFASFEDLAHILSTEDEKLGVMHVNCYGESPIFVVSDEKLNYINKQFKSLD